MDKSEYWKSVEEYRRKYPQARYGQALFNIFHDFNSELANAILGTDRDPFYDVENGERVYSFVKFIEEEVLCDH